MQPVTIPPVSEPRRYDELRGPDGELRAHWRVLIERLRAAGPEAARRGTELARRLVIENGVTYNVYADPQGRDRPWVLDPLPFVLPQSEWREIEAGMQQRAALLDALLADLYGPQTLIASGAVPAALVFGHPNFLWPCRGVRPADGTWLHVYAADLARGPDGRWWVLGDRAQTPSGQGYALENRQIVSRVHPELTRELGALPIDDCFAGLRARLFSQVGPRERPLAVVLTPGPFNETWFEHAYLARHLGLPLVEGHDLTVRGTEVYLKTLSGLRRVHAILRRLDDDFCDPVELRADSALGVPGLLGAVRAGRVILANALGTGVLESAAWLGFLPGIARQLRGEALRLPSVATWWCGERPALDYVADNLDSLVVKPAFPDQRFEPVFGRDLDTAARAKLLDRVRRRPRAYVAQERIALSRAPTWAPRGDGALDAKSVVIRVYALASAEGYVVMPGGLARIAGEGAEDIVSSQRGGGSKDVWVLGGAPLEEDEAPAAEPARVATRRDDLPSGLVENLFWLGRYAERSEDKTRLLRATFAVRADPRAWERALASCHRQGVLEPGRDPVAGLFDREAPEGLAADLGRLAWCATRTRSCLSAEHWRSLNTMHRQFDEAQLAHADPRETLDGLLLGLAALAGFTLDDMTQDDGWRLMMLGRELERLHFLAGLIAESLHEGALPHTSELEWLLDVGGSTITYRTRWLSSPRLLPVLELLVFDETNPRALAFHWRGVRHTLVQLAASLGGPVEDTLESAIHRLKAAPRQAMEKTDEEGVAARASFAQGLLALQAATERLCDRIGMRHFSHTGEDLQMVAS